jgi:peptidyl-prolyl cis-trans isomerase C
LVRGLIEQEVRTPRPDAETCRRYYEQNRKLFRSTAIYEAAHILFAARQDRPDVFAEARKRAEAGIQELSQHPERFADLARAHSACPSAAVGGNLGQITTGQTTPEFEQALMALQDGEITASPVETRYGLHIIRLDRRIEGRDLPFEAVAERIAGYLAESVTRRATAQYIARLVSRSEIAGITLDGSEAHRVN